VELSVDVSKIGAKIDHNIFVQFAEHLGNGIYDGIWGGGPYKPKRAGIRASATLKNEEKPTRGRRIRDADLIVDVGFGF
jgi:hypothetical protein